MNRTEEKKNYYSKMKNLKHHFQTTFTSFSIYNKNYFYTPKIQGLYKMYENKYIDEPLTNYFVIESDEDKIIELIKKEID